MRLDDINDEMTHIYGLVYGIVNGKAKLIRFKMSVKP